MATTKTSPYELLSAPFEHTFTDVRGGVELTYLTGEQVATRLNQVLGVGGWSFRVLRHDVSAEADEAWALGEIVAEIDGKSVTRQQFGSQKIKRSRSSGVPLDIGFDLKGAATDAMKKCASLLGVGLYLSRKEVPPTQLRQESSAAGQERLACETCGVELRETRFKDGSVWDPAQLAGYGRRKHGQVLCFTHYRLANDQRKPSSSLGEVTA
jgi:Rad52/22 family double-strand break repair protein